MTARAITPDLSKLRKHELLSLLQDTASALRYVHDQHYTSDRHKCARTFSIMCEPLVYLKEATDD